MKLYRNIYGEVLIIDDADNTHYRTIVNHNPLLTGAVSIHMFQDSNISFESLLPSLTTGCLLIKGLNYLMNCYHDISVEDISVSILDCSDDTGPGFYRCLRIRGEIVIQLFTSFSGVIKAKIHSDHLDAQELAFLQWYFKLEGSAVYSLGTLFVMATPLVFMKTDDSYSFNMSNMAVPDDHRPVPEINSTPEPPQPPTEILPPVKTTREQHRLNCIARVLRQIQ